MNIMVVMQTWEHSDEISELLLQMCKLTDSAKQSKQLPLRQEEFEMLACMNMPGAE